MQYPEEAHTFYSQATAVSSRPPSSLDILGYARHLQFSDPKDRIYAFLAFKTPDNTLSAVQPNYRKGVSHLAVYLDIAIKYLEKTKDLDILRFVEHDNGESLVDVDDPRTQSLPSWVPRWDRGCLSSSFGRGYRKITFAGTEQSGSRPPMLSDVDGSPVLRVRAVFLGRITYASPMIHTSQYPAKDKMETVELIGMWRDLAPQLQKYPGPHRDNFSRAFLATLHLDRKAPSEEYDQSLCEVARNLQSERPSKFDLATQTVSVFTAQICQNKRFVLLDRGYYGAAPYATQKSDLCAIISGARTPLILREVSGKRDQYRVVGPVHVLSKQCVEGVPLRLAQDESCDDWKDWKLPSEDIILV